MYNCPASEGQPLGFYWIGVIPGTTTIVLNWTEHRVYQGPYPLQYKIGPVTGEDRAMHVVGQLRKYLDLDRI